MNYNFGIIGCGFIGNKRADAIREIGHNITMVYDINPENAKRLARRVKAEVADNVDQVIEKSDINIVATTNKYLSEYSIRAVRKGKHVLVEKPCGRNPEEVERIVQAKNEAAVEVVVKAGFNHRFHPAIQKAKEIFESGELGPLMFVCSRYGHGARIGYNKEWRGLRDYSGGGEWLDQGSHIIDLSRLFAGDFEYNIGYCDNFFWYMEVEDNCFAILKNKDGIIAQLHASCTEWKNKFSMEIYCKEGKLDISGLGGSYGLETLTYYKMKPEMGPPDKFVYEYPGADVSWKIEIEDMIDAIENHRRPNGDILDALKSIRIVFDIYAWDINNNPKKYNCQTN
jgi:predicted dehydrogenase